MNKKKIVGFTLVGVLLAFLAAYFIGRQYYSSHFFPKTAINNVACGNLTEQATADTMAESLKTYELTIHDAVTDMTVDAADAGLEMTEDSQLAELLQKQDASHWFQEFGKEHEYTVMNRKLNQEQLKAYLNTLECMNPEKVQKPVSAKIKYSKKSKSFEIVEETVSNILLKKKFYQAVEEAILAQEPQLDLTTNAYYKHPKYMSDSKAVVKAKKKVDKYMSAVINYEHGDFKFTLDGKGIHQFIRVNKNMKVLFSKDKMVDYIVDHICKEFNTIGTSRTIYSPGSGNITISGGAYGWRVNVQKERFKLEKEIKKGKTVTREPIYMQEAKSREKGNDIGDSYVDVSISAQHLWVIRDGSIVFSSDFVSGNPNLGRQTDKGVHFVEYKRTNYDMSNYNVSVKYWLPFNTAEGEGFHDATWRNTFGGSYYLRDGSHGCINLPLYAAQTLYNMLPCGYPVVVH